MSGQYWYEKRIDQRGKVYNAVIDKGGNRKFWALLAAYVIGMALIVLVIVPNLPTVEILGRQVEFGGSILLTLLGMLGWTFLYLRISNRMVARRTKPGEPVPDVAGKGAPS